ncbi:MAG: hypothetical protein JRJ66_02240 [Deltaproteobacteria bacterium]|nr:hypothetical protein [Deltaproteobacteria bacterium]
MSGGNMGELRLSDHFIERWREYFKESPSIYHVLQILKRSKWIQGYRRLFDEQGNPHIQLATYWHPERKVVIKVDWLENKVVTVITPQSRKRGAENQEHRRE